MSGCRATRFRCWRPCASRLNNRRWFVSCRGLRFPQGAAARACWSTIHQPVARAAGPQRISSILAFGGREPGSQDHHLGKLANPGGAPRVTSCLIAAADTFRAGRGAAGQRSAESAAARRDRQNPSAKADPAAVVFERSGPPRPRAPTGACRQRPGRCRPSTKLDGRTGQGAAASSTAWRLPAAWNRLLVLEPPGRMLAPERWLSRAPPAHRRGAPPSPRRHARGGVALRWPRSRSAIPALLRGEGKLVICGVHSFEFVESRCWDLSHQ